jgi:hypothetical protein
LTRRLFKNVFDIEGLADNTFQMTVDRDHAILDLIRFFVEREKAKIGKSKYREVCFAFTYASALSFYSSILQFKINPLQCIVGAPGKISKK